MFFYCITTSLAIISLTQTSEGWAWLQNYSYAKTGNTEASVGVGLLKLLTLNWDKLNNNQKNWCKEYLPFLLQNYRDYGANAIAANTRNDTLYDFMARSVNGAQCTYKSKVSGTTMQQEFFNYVVNSGYGFGQFVQNIIGGGTYTAIANGRTFSGIDLKDILDTSTLHRAPNSNVDYTATDEGDGDYDWFNHAMYLYSKNGSNSQFATIYKLVINNGTAKADYADWLARFHGKDGASESWGYLNNQTGTNGHMISADWWNSANGSTGKLSDGDPAWIDGTNYSNQFVMGYNFGRNNGGYYKTFGWNNSANGTWTWYTPLNQVYSNFNTITVSFGGRDKSFRPQPNGIQVRILGGSTSGPVIASALTTNHCSLTITAEQWNKYKNLYLQVYVPDSTLKKMGDASGNNSDTGFSIALTGVTFKWIGSQQKCIDGHNFDDYTYSYSDDYQKVVVSHKCKTCGVEESEVLSVDNGKVIVDDHDELKTIYTYKPAQINHSSWTKEISKDLGTGIVTYTATSGATKVGGNWSAYNNKYSVSYSHRNYGYGQYQAVTSEAVIAEGASTVKTGAIKANVKSITVNSEHTNPSEYMTVNVYGGDDKLLKSNSGYDSVTVNLSDLSVVEKDGCWISVTYSRSRYAETLSAISSTWWNYPAAFPIDVTATIKNVVITY